MLETAFIFLILFLSIFLLSFGLFPASKIASTDGKDKSSNREDLPFRKAVLKNLNSFNNRAIPKSYRNLTGGMISRAGLENKIPPHKFLIFQEALSMGFLFLFAMLAGFHKLFSPKILLVSFGAGILLPLFYLSRSTRIKKEKIAKCIPFYADLLTLSCEAGLDIFASISNITQNSEKSHLREIFENILKDIKLGKSRQKALREAYRDTDIWELKTIYLTILQAETLGTPIGQALRDQVEIMRRNRMNRAERMAQEAPLKLMIPLILLVFPVTLILLISPILIKFLQGDIL